MSPDDRPTCAHCGQPLPAGHVHVHGYGDKRVNASGMAITVLLHLLLLAAFLLRPHVTKPPALTPGGAIAYVAPLPAKPKPKPRQAPAKPVARVQERVQMTRLPDTITLPREQPVQPPPPAPEPPKVEKVEPEMDMAAMIEARRRARGQVEQPAEESEAERGNRIARANIAAANGRKSGEGGADGAFSVADVTFNSAQVKLNTKFLGSARPSLKQETAELGDEIDIETAIVKKLVQMLRKEKFIDFNFTSQRLQRTMPMSTRPEYAPELEAMLMKELFPNYRPPRRH